MNHTSFPGLATGPLPDFRSSIITPPSIVCFFGDCDGLETDSFAFGVLASACDKLFFFSFFSILPGVPCVFPGVPFAGAP